MPGPRVFAIPAAEANVVAVLRRGPSGWAALGRWDLDAHTYDPGTWLHATVYPQRCDLSPDGRWFAAFVLNQHADWPAGTAYVSLSRLPWLTALAAWEIGSTWTQGVHFVDDPGVWPADGPEIGDPAPCRQRYGLAWTRAASFAVERRRGWVETADTPPRAPDDAWDQLRQVTMEKPCPGAGEPVLRVSGWHAAFRAFEPTRFGPSAYWLQVGDRRVELDDVQWADWSRDGALLTVATYEGRLKSLDPVTLASVWEHDLSAESPTPSPPPPQAYQW